MVFGGDSVRTASGEEVNTKGIRTSRALEKRIPQNGTHHRNEIWILAKLLNESIVTGISTLGYNDSSEKEWITDYMLMYSTGKEYLSFKETSGEVKVRRYLVIAVYLAPFLFLFELL